MDISTQRSRRADADMLRRFVLAILIMGIVGTGAELVLLEHMEDFWQWVPLVLFVAALPCAGWLLVAPGVVSVRIFQIVMVLFVVSGFVGQWLHYKGNVEFELEMYPSRGGLELVWEALGGATPSLAPGTMTLLGLLGLAVCFRHPDLSSAGKRNSQEER
ncbi:MAG: hypothetical protein OXH16_06750 [Gemmatimonadetes bacterium]|nr:hypothetical protein [Gemmatimonadota bacterium]